MTIQDLINDSKKLLLEFKKPEPKVDLADFHRKYLDPPRIHKCFNLLAPVGFKWRDEILEQWLPLLYPINSNDWRTVIIHGHDRDKVCQNRDLCHVLGFIPVGTEHPWFLKEWEKFNYDQRRIEDQGLEIDGKKESSQGTLF